jgi:uncharacterized membrane protein
MVSETTTGLKKETAAGLSYILGPVTGILFLILEKNEFIRFHAMQSIIFSVLVFALNMIFSLSRVLVFLNSPLWLIAISLGLFAMFKASQGEKWEMPVIGQFAKKLLTK